LSYNNLLDADAAWSCVNEFASPACVIVKHANPCGVSAADTIEEAYQYAYETDPVSAFGGIIALNRPCTKNLAEAIISLFTEVVLAPAFTDEALKVFSTKPNLRILELPLSSSSQWEMKFIAGGMLLQEKDSYVLKSIDLKTVTRVKPTPTEMDAMIFAWRVVKHIKSNAILVAAENRTLGIGAGQVSRVDAVNLALAKALKLQNKESLQNTIVASDAFFPFRDSIDQIAKTGVVRAIIQPGGSVHDEKIIEACNEHHLAMVFTGKRCFKH
jgi:phosphoribosylaminoimidazolecarboxamide formyltransferase/IMP cyclohydrolase